MAFANATKSVLYKELLAKLPFRGCFFRLSVEMWEVWAAISGMMRLRHHHQYAHAMDAASRELIMQRWSVIQEELLPQLKSEVGALTPKLERVIHILEWVRIEEFVASSWCGLGRPPFERAWLANAFVAKVVLGVGTTTGLIERLTIDRALRRICGFPLHRKLPSEATFSRAFEAFARARLAERVHEVLIRRYLGDRLIGHLSRDGTAIEARERRAGAAQTASCRSEGALFAGEQPSGPAAPATAPKSPRGRPRKGEARRAAIPLSRISAARVTNLYDVMDAAYCSLELHEHCRSLGHVPLIDHNRRGDPKIECEPSDALRYNERAVVERSNARLKDEFGARSVRVTGPIKVMSHLMFGVLVLSADQLMRLLQ